MRMAAVLTAACIMLVLAPGKGRTEELSPQARTILETLEDRPGECVHIAPAKTKGRLAVVSANAGYRNGITPLQNPLNDAAVMGAALSKLDFELYMLTDFSRGAAAECIDEAIAENPQVNVAVFHYSGHGIQIRDVNYLIGVDYAPDEPAADNDLIDLQAMLDRLTAAARSSMVFLDACRDNPFASADLPGLSVSTGRSAGSSKGGSTPAATSANAQPAGIFVAYSTSPNSTATDGTGDVSPFSAALARNIVKPGTSVQKAMAMVTREVGEATDWSQTPWSRSSLTDELILGARYSLDDLEQSINDKMKFVRSSRRFITEVNRFLDLLPADSNALEVERFRKRLNQYIEVFQEAVKAFKDVTDHLNGRPQPTSPNQPNRPNEPNRPRPLTQRTGSGEVQSASDYLSRLAALRN